MLMYIPSYRQHGQQFHSPSPNRLSPSSTLNGQNNTTITNQLNQCQITSSILCRFTFSLLLIIIALFLFLLSNDDETDQKGSSLMAAILFTIAVISCIRTCQKSRRYYVILHTRRQLLQRLREQQQAYNLTLLLNNNENLEPIRNINTDLPSYKELFSSHPDISNSGTDPLPSYDDYVKTLVIHQSTMSLPISSQTNSTQCIWITDQTRQPLCIRGTVTYV